MCRNSRTNPEPADPLLVGCTALTDDYFADNEDLLTSSVGVVQHQPRRGEWAEECTDPMTEYIENNAEDHGAETVNIPETDVTSKNGLRRRNLGGL